MPGGRAARSRRRRTQGRSAPRTRGTARRSDSGRGAAGFGRERGVRSAAAMSFLSLQQAAAAPRRVSARRVAAPIRQKLLFVSGHSDEEDEDEEEEGGSSGNSTGEDSAFQEADSPLSAARTPARGDPPLLEEEEEEEMEPAAAPLPEEGDSWEEEGFGSSPVKSPGAYFMAGSPSPPPSYKGRRYCGRSPPHPAASGYRLRSEEPGSPLPDCPGTPPHKTFRKLRLFDTPHTPKVRHPPRRGPPPPLTGPLGARAEGGGGWGGVCVCVLGRAGLGGRPAPGEGGARRARGTAGGLNRGG